VDKRKEANLNANTSHNFFRIYMRFWPSQDYQHLIMCRLFQCGTINLILTKYQKVCVKIFHEEKLQAFVKLQITRNQLVKNFPKKKNLSRAEQRYVSRTAIKVNKTGTRCDVFISS